MIFLVSAVKLLQLRFLLSFLELRHTCELDDSVHFGWLKHDGRSYGNQRIADSVHQTEFQIQFAKLWSDSAVSREAWAVHLQASPSMARKKLSLLFYLAYDGEEALKLRKIEDKEFVGWTGWTAESGHFALAARKTDFKPTLITDQLEGSRVWTVHEFYNNKMRSALQTAYMSLGQGLFNLPDLSQIVKLTSDAKAEAANVAAFQFIAPNDAQISLFYVPLSPNTAKSPLKEVARQEKLLKSAMESAPNSLKSHISERFSIPKKFEEFATYALANLLGGISYFYGDSVVQKGTVGVPQRTIESSLFTDVPARANFPRGFYWDSGFHNILLAKWDVNLSLEILSNWIDKIDADGWVGREQILGDEARSRVPREYITQNTEYSNPPAPILPILMITSQIGKENQIITDKLHAMYPKLKRHFKWFMANQRAQLLDDFSDAFLFRWRGRSGHHTLTSGLDDYPRGNVPSQYELHVDLLSWMALMARSLQEMAAKLEISEDELDYGAFLEEAKHNLDQYHWDDERGCFADCTVNESGDALAFVPNTGYVSLFPMLFGLVDPQDSKLSRLLDIIEDPNQLWSE